MTGKLLIKNERYNKLMTTNEPLTQEETKEGWMFCNCEWDGMLIKDDWPEVEFCHCYQDSINKLKGNK